MSTSTSDRFAAPASDDQLTHAAEALATRGFEVRQVDTAGAARDLVADSLPTDRTIFTTASETLLKAKAPDEQGLQQMGGTGLEPVTPPACRDDLRIHGCSQGFLSEASLQAFPP